VDGVENVDIKVKGSAVDVFLSGGPMRIIVFEVHNPSPKVK